VGETSKVQALPSKKRAQERTLMVLALCSSQRPWSSRRHPAKDVEVDGNAAAFFLLRVLTAQKTSKTSLTFTFLSALSFPTSLET
jgi:hypothetical protein